MPRRASSHVQRAHRVVSEAGAEPSGLEQVRSYRFCDMAEVEADAAADAAGPSGSGAAGPSSAAVLSAEISAADVKTAYRVRVGGASAVNAGQRWSTLVNAGQQVGRQLVYMDTTMTKQCYAPPKRMQLVGFVAADQVERHKYMKVPFYPTNTLCGALI